MFARGEFNRGGETVDGNNITDVVKNQYDFKNGNLQGIKYNHYGSRTGYASALDTAIIDRNLKKERENMGEGYVKLQVVNGGVNKPININNRLWYPSQDDGTFTIIDGKAIDTLVEREREKREYIEKIIEDCTLSDDVCALSLGVSLADLKKELGSGGNGWGSAMDRDIILTDATPSMLEVYAEDSITYARAVMKLKSAVKKKMPIIERMTTEKQLDED